MELEEPEAVWPLRIAACCKSLRGNAAPAERSALRAELWLLIHGALMRYLRARARGGFPPREDLEDIASAKAIEVLQRCESGVWAPEGRTLGEIASYVASVARNGFVDFTRRARRAVSKAVAEEDEGEDGDFDSRTPRADDPPPHALVEARELARALVECARRLQPRARRVWFFRAFHDMTSREIAAHPAIGLDAAYVDVVAKRARDFVRACLEEKGLDAAEPPPGAFVELWAALESLAESDPDAEGEATR